MTRIKLPHLHLGWTFVYDIGTSIYTQLSTTALSVSQTVSQPMSSFLRTASRRFIQQPTRTTALRTFTTTAAIMAQKHEWIVILPDNTGALEKRMSVRQYEPLSLFLSPTTIPQPIPPSSLHPSSILHSPHQSLHCNLQSLTTPHRTDPTLAA